MSTLEYVLLGLAYLAVFALPFVYGSIREYYRDKAHRRRMLDVLDSIERAHRLGKYRRKSS